MVQNQCQNCVNMQSPTISTALSGTSTDREQPLVQTDPSAKAIITFPILTRDSSLDNDMMVISIQESTKTTQTPTSETQCISMETSTKTESVTVANVDTQAPVRETQSVNSETEMRSTMIHSSLNLSQSPKVADINKKLYELLNENKELKEMSEKVVAHRKDVLSVCQDLLSVSYFKYYFQIGKPSIKIIL